MQQPAANTSRHALLVGNTSYSTLTPVLVAQKEMDLMAAALRDADFDVITIANAKLPDFAESTVKAFLDRIRGGDTCLFYYSGYAFQGRDGDNYMVPVNFDRTSPLDLEAKAYPFVRLEQDLEERHAGLRIFIIEASRTLGVPGLLDGLAIPDPDAREILFASATQPNRTVENAPDGEPGWFTRLIAENIRKKPGLSLHEVFERAQRGVALQTNQFQVPFVAANFTGEFFFHNPEKKLLIARNHLDRTDYVLIPAGEFQMGCIPGDLRCSEDEKPQHRVRIGHSFWMATTEVDITAYQRFLAAQKENHQKEKMPAAPLWDRGWKQTNHPIVNVAWEQARSFCTWAGGRLPTEAEWEYAARGGHDNQIYPLNDENSREKANFYGKKGNDIFDYTAPVGSFDSNPFQLFDMAGNVWQWTEDAYSPTAYTRHQGGLAVDPKELDSLKSHVARGGSWDSNAKEHLRISIRKPFTKESNNLGFRCVLEDVPPVHRLLQIP